jgi:hypothetical protein
MWPFKSKKKKQQQKEEAERRLQLLTAWAEHGKSFPYSLINLICFF